MPAYVTLHRASTLALPCHHRPQVEMDICHRPKVTLIEDITVEPEVSRTRHGPARPCTDLLVLSSVHGSRRVLGLRWVLSIAT